MTIFIIYLIGAIIAYVITRKNTDDNASFFCTVLSWITVLFFGIGFLLQWSKDSNSENDQ